MIKIIMHRINTISELKKIPCSYGVEIDVRSQNNKLILNHDPFKQGEKLSNWLNFYSHSFLIINVKEEGLEKNIFKLLKKFKVKNFFFLDQSFPFLIKHLKFLSKKTAVRFSEYESIETVLNLKNKVNWVWVDCFSKKPISKINFQKIKKTRIKICYVSPELQGEKNIKKIKDFIKKIKKNKLHPEAVCTKFPQLWN